MQAKTTCCVTNDPRHRPLPQSACVHVPLTTRRVRFPSLQALVIKGSWNKRACVCANTFILQRIRFAFPLLRCPSRLMVFTGRLRFQALCNACLFVWASFFFSQYVDQSRKLIQPARVFYCVTASRGRPAIDSARLLAVSTYFSWILLLTECCC